MPTYDYKCPGCGEVREEFHGVNTVPLVKCECGREMLKQISGGLDPVYKGPGWTKQRKPSN